MAAAKMTSHTVKSAVLSVTAIAPAWKSWWGRPVKMQRMDPAFLSIQQSWGC